MRDTCGSRRSDSLAALAAKQHGAFSLAQAEANGYSRSAVFRRVRAGHFRQVFPRVYRFSGAPPSFDQRAMAMTLWATPNAVASHVTAAALWGVATPGPVLHVTADRKLTRPPRAVRSHVAERLPHRERGTLRGIPVTSVARTMVDLAAGHPEGELLPMVERAVLEGLVTSGQLRDVVERHRGGRGCRRLEEAVAEAASSALERRVDAILRHAKLPAYRREYPVGRFRLDFAWPEHLLAIEADGRRWHSSAAGFARDRAKANYLTERGWRILRVTWSDLDEPGEWVRVAASLLDRQQDPFSRHTM